jgi:hypothetical protein
MPKKSLTIRDFSSGIIVSEHGADLPDNTIVNGSNHNVYRKAGLVELSGAFETAQKPDEGNSNEEDFTLPSDWKGIRGRGNFYFPSDYGNMKASLGTAGGDYELHAFNNNEDKNWRLGAISQESRPTEYYIVGVRHPNFVTNANVAGDVISAISIYQIDRKGTYPMGGSNSGLRNGWIMDIPLGGVDGDGAYDQSNSTHSSDYFPVYFIARGALRVCDGSFQDYNTRKLFIGYERQVNGLFSGLADQEGSNSDAEEFKMDQWVLDGGGVENDIATGKLYKPETKSIITHNFIKPDTDFLNNAINLVFCGASVFDIGNSPGYSYANAIQNSQNWNLDIDGAITNTTCTFSLDSFDTNFGEGQIGVSIGMTSNGLTQFSGDGPYDGETLLAEGISPDSDLSNIYISKAIDTDLAFNMQVSIPTWKIYASYIYENGEESELSEFGNIDILGHDGFELDNVNESSIEGGLNDIRNVTEDNTHYSQYFSTWVNCSDIDTEESFHKPTSLLVNWVINPEFKRAHPRIRGCKLYFSYNGNMSTIYADHNSHYNMDIDHLTGYNLLSEMDFEKGGRNPGSSEWNAWLPVSQDQMDSGSSTMYHCYTTCHTLGLETFQTAHGYDWEDIKSCYYKTALPVNNRLYVGNVKFNGELFPDRMMKTQIGEYDTFTKHGFIDVAVDDGESIVHLEAFADRILQFKETTLHIINISKDYEFLESSHKHAGVKSPCQVVSTDYGIFWANRGGLYQYDGKNVINLLSSIKSNFVSEAATLSSNYIVQNIDKWGNIISEDPGYEPIVSYDPINKEIIVLSQGVTDLGFVYHIDSRVMTQIFNKSDVGGKSNSILTVNGDTMYVLNSTYDGAGSESNSGRKFRKWNSEASAESNLSLLLLTKAIDFGNHAQRKVIQSISFTYKCNGAPTLVPYVTGYFLDGASPQTWYLCTSSASGVSNLTSGSYEGQLPNTSNKIETFKYKHVLDSNTSGSATSLRGQLKNVGAIQIGLAKLSSTNTIQSSFALEEIAITYRGKSHK